MSSETRDKNADVDAFEDVMIPLRHGGRWVGVVVVSLVVLYLVIGAVTNDKMHWDVVGKYLFAPTVMSGMGITIQITFFAMLIGVGLGTLLAVMRLSPNKVLSGVALGYILLFRGVPVIVQLLFWYFLSALIPHLGVGIPFGPQFFQVPTNQVISQLGAALLGFGLNEAAYMAEIVRSGIMSVDRGQREAASAIGMTKTRAFWRIVLPQAMRIIIPPTGNEVISMLKTTSLVLVIALPDLLTAVTEIYAQNFLQIPLLIVASFWYLVLTGILTVGQYYIERHYGQSTRGVRTRMRPARGAKTIAGAV